MCFWDVIRLCSGCMIGNELWFKMGSFSFFKDSFIVVWNVDKLMIWLVFFNGYNLCVILFVCLWISIMYFFVVGIIF